MLKFLADVKEAAADPASPLHGKLDLENLGAAGHSRGAKIAALHFAGGDGVRDTVPLREMLKTIWFQHMVALPFICCVLGLK